MLSRMPDSEVAGCEPAFIARRRKESRMLIIVLLAALGLATVAGPVFTADAIALTALVAGLACLVQAVRRSGPVRMTWIGLGLAMLAGSLGYGAAVDDLPGAGYFGL